MTKERRERRHLVKREKQAAVKLIVGNKDEGFHLWSEALRKVQSAYEAGDQVARLIEHWRRWATVLIESEGKDPTKYRALAEDERDGLDRVRAAALTLQRLDKIERYAKLPDISMAALEQALLLATDVHQLTVVDNERDIVRGEDARATLTRNNAAQGINAKKSRDAMRGRADQVWAKHPGWPASNVARTIAGEFPNYKVGTIRRWIARK